MTCYVLRLFCAADVKNTEIVHKYWLLNNKHLLDKLSLVKCEFAKRKKLLEKFACNIISANSSPTSLKTVVAKFTWNNFSLPTQVLKLLSCEDAFTVLVIFSFKSFSNNITFEIMTKHFDFPVSCFRP